MLGWLVGWLVVLLGWCWCFWFCFPSASVVTVGFYIPGVFFSLGKSPLVYLAVRQYSRQCERIYLNSSYLDLSRRKKKILKLISKLCLFFLWSRSLHVHYEQLTLIFGDTVGLNILLMLVQMKNGQLSSFFTLKLPRESRKTKKSRPNSFIVEARKTSS